MSILAPAFSIARRNRGMGRSAPSRRLRRDKAELASDSPFLIDHRSVTGRVETDLCGKTRALKRVGALEAIHARIDQGYKSSLHRTEGECEEGKHHLWAD